jgi:hypothetical protein
MTNFVAFDIEIAKEIPENADWHGIAPLGVSCASTYNNMNGELILWHSTTLLENGMWASAMSAHDVDDMLKYMLGVVELDGFVVTWNGLGFDFDVLTHECSPDMVPIIHRLARYNHIDPMFQIFCEKGFPLGLQNASKGMGLPGKLEGMHGDLAPKLWAQSRSDQDEVLRYVGQDSVATADLYKAICRAGKLTWNSKSGKLVTWNPIMQFGRLLTVDECNKLPVPNTSWMIRGGGTPWTREKFMGWLK